MFFFKKNFGAAQFDFFFNVDFFLSSDFFLKHCVPEILLAFKGQFCTMTTSHAHFFPMEKQSKSCKFEVPAAVYCSVVGSVLNKKLCLNHWTVESKVIFKLCSAFLNLDSQSLNEVRQSNYIFFLYTDSCNT